MSYRRWLYLHIAKYGWYNEAGTESRVTYTGVKLDFNMTWCSCICTVTRRVALVEQELLLFWTSEFTHGLLWPESYCSLLSFLCSVL